MSDDVDPRSEQVRLPGFVEQGYAGDPPPGPRGRPAAADETTRSRTQGRRGIRRMSNWTAAALVVGAGAAVVGLAHSTVPATAPTVPAGATQSSTGVGTPVATHGTRGPQVSHSVATTSASGVTTTTTTHVVNGKTVVTKVRHVPAFHDD